MAKYSDDGLGFLPGLLIGAAIGAVSALLLAPKRGKELQTDLADAATQAAQTASEAVQQGAQLMQSATETASQTAQTLTETISERAQEFKTSAIDAADVVDGEVVDGARETIDKLDDAVQDATPEETEAVDNADQNGAAPRAAEAELSDETPVSELAAQLDAALHAGQDETLEQEADADDAAVGLSGRDFATTSANDTPVASDLESDDAPPIARDAGDKTRGQDHDVIDAV